MPPDGWAQVRRVLAVRLDNIGDVVMLGPALRTLRAALPAARITLLVSPAGSQVAPLLPWVDEVLVYRSVWQDASGALPFDPARETALIAMLQAGRYDAAAIFTSFSQSPYPPAYVCYLAGIPIRLGQSKEFGGAVLSHPVVPLPDPTHQAERNLHLLEAAGFAVGDRSLELQVPEAVAAAADAKLRVVGVDPGAGFIVLAPGASCPARRYDPARYAAVGRALALTTDRPIVVVGSARETELIAPILAAAPPGRIMSIAGTTTVPELAAVIRHASLLIANDSGPMHMADAFRRPMVILYAGTEWETQWRPRDAPARLLRRPTMCSPCYRFVCPYGMECLDIPPAEVVAAALGMLDSTAGRSIPLLAADAASR